MTTQHEIYLFLKNNQHKKFRPVDIATSLKLIKSHERIAIRVQKVYWYFKEIKCDFSRNEITGQRERWYYYEKN